jgi:hypothetical protein
MVRWNRCAETGYLCFGEGKSGIEINGLLQSMTNAAVSPIFYFLAAAAPPPPVPSIDLIRTFVLFLNLLRSLTHRSWN